METLSGERMNAIRPSRGGNSSGKVEVRALGLEGRICRENWDDRDAAVLCRSQGYRNGIAYSHFK